jgi:hypothetical protein
MLGGQSDKDADFGVESPPCTYMVDLISVINHSNAIDGVK